MNKQNLLITILAFLLVGSAIGQPTRTESRKVAGAPVQMDMQKAAEKSLADYQSLLDSVPPTTPVGAAVISSPLGSATAPNSLGVPKKDYFIRLDSLKCFKAGKNVEDLIVDSKQMHYTVYKNKKPTGTITMVQKKNGWTMVSIGDAELTKLRQNSINQSMKRFQKAESDHFIVRVPALGIEFTAFRNANKELQLASVADNIPAGLTAGEAEPAERILLRLVPLALDYKNLQAPN